MFTKKYVGPVNCASCDKGIVNLLGQPVDYHVWKRLPFREPSERIARVSTHYFICRIKEIKLVLCLYIVWPRLLQDPHYDEA